MSTRGIMGFSYNGELKLTYNHFDSYPSCLGVEMAQAAVLIRNRLGHAIERFGQIEMVKQRDCPTPEQLVRVNSEWPEAEAGETDEWYDILRTAQGDPMAWIDGGLNFMSDDQSFVRDSLFCEWGWILNLGTGHLEIYIGSQKNPHACGQFCALERTDYGPDFDDYYPIACVAWINFGDIPESEDDIIALMRGIETAVYGCQNEEPNCELSESERVCEFIKEWRLARSDKG